MKIISDIDNENENYIEPIISFLKELFLSKSYKNNKQILEFIILVYIDLLSIDIGQKKSEANQLEISLIKILEKKIQRLEIIHDRNKRIEENLSKSGKTKKVLVPELQYILIWLYRRNNDFAKMAEIEEKLLNNYPNDGRFFHGFGIGYKSLFYSVKIQESKTEYLYKANYYLEIAIEKYKKILEEINIFHLKELAIRNIIGVFNSLCDSYIRLYTITLDSEYIIKGREQLENLKSLILEIERNYLELPILNNTEAELEYYEALILINKQEIKLAKRKLKYAIKSYNKSTIAGSLMDEKFKEVGSKIEKLQMELSTKN